MIEPARYPYTPADVQYAYDTLFADVFTRPAVVNISTVWPPKILIVAGVQGSGKTYLLENALLPSGNYNNYVRLYLPAFRELHPHYQAMRRHGVLHAYEHTENFVRAVCGKIFNQAFSFKYNVIMECALDDINFANVPDMVTGLGYQFDVHLIACKKEFAHLSTIKRALNSLTDQTLERFVDMTAIDVSMGNAQGILTSFENACMRASGSKLTLYERGLGVLKNRRVVCSSVCTDGFELLPQPITNNHGDVISPAQNTVSIIRTPTLNTPCSYSRYCEIVNAPIETRTERGEMLKECHLALTHTNAHSDNVHFSVFNDLYAYIAKHLYRY
ncbi:MULTISPECIES: zeta toxin family protein [unclassified Pseudomonas]|uniref:zeta toxin family protein n=1 Tax=unclassified Pseudomonas TaxID=196821 RepID=UPI002B223F28|nr:MULTISPECIES: zeta toxin family protein [unclassified Pseudomonas]MEA9977093.1 zeta toxin family protein [Pseudomonas sp. RTS4]MEB0197705.1 zeta toxin family protein [Pseudomonas sp. 5S4]MEB0246821.1 zeta toxin family protein [Pseudomonas sp. 10S5]